MLDILGDLGAGLGLGGLGWFGEQCGGKEPDSEKRGRCHPGPEDKVL